ncbi:MAG: type II toxin-antitoxin system HigB family toxin [Elusimicrobia bacterium]|nr:type II toxin-antitoxin system HigB family toxin [Elusimicrobiota bacterium]
MEVFGWDIADAFLRDHPKATKSLEAWRQVMQDNSFGHLADLKRVIRSADYVKPHTVFNISKNKYRLIAQVSYPLEAVRIESILTHEEYDSGKWRRGP